MIKIEKVRVVKTLKCKDKTYWVGQVFPERAGGDIPPDLLTEARLNTGTVDILLQSEVTDGKEKEVQEEKEEGDSNGEPEGSEEKKVSKLISRK